MKTNQLMLAGLTALGLSAAWALADDPSPAPATPATPAAAALDAPGAGGRRAGRQGPRGEITERLRDQFQQRNPEEYKKLMELRDTDPEAFRAKMREIMQKNMQFGGPGGRGMALAEEEKANEIAKRYLAASAPEEKEQIKAELRKAVEAAFDKRMELQQQRFGDLEGRVKKAKEELETRQKNRDSIIQNRMDELTKDPKLRWGGAAAAPDAGPVTSVPVVPPRVAAEK